MIYGYARCSTNEKLQDINRQVRELKQQGATDETIYLEYESYVTDCTDMEDVLQMLIGTGGNPVTVHGCTGAALRSLRRKSAELHAVQNSFVRSSSLRKRKN